MTKALIPDIKALRQVGRGLNAVDELPRRNRLAAYRWIHSFVASKIRDLENSQ